MIQMERLKQLSDENLRRPASNLPFYQQSSLITRRSLVGRARLLITSLFNQFNCFQRVCCDWVELVYKRSLLSCCSWCCSIILVRLPHVCVSSQAELVLFLKQSQPSFSIQLVIKLSPQVKTVPNPSKTRELRLIDD